MSSKSHARSILKALAGPRSGDLLLPGTDVGLDAKTREHLQSRLGDADFVEQLLAIAESSHSDDQSLRTHALKQLARLRDEGHKARVAEIEERLIQLLRSQIQTAREQGNGNPNSLLGDCILTVLGLRLPSQEDDRSQLLDELLAPNVPVGVREAALKNFAERDGLDAIERLLVFPIQAGRDLDAMLAFIRKVAGRPRRLDRLPPSSFEHLIAHLLRLEFADLHVTVRGKAKDHGVDVVLYDGRARARGSHDAWPVGHVRWVVQCKRWRDTAVPRSEVDALLVAAAKHSSNAIFVTTSRYDSECDELLRRARHRSASLIDPQGSGEPWSVTLDAEQIEEIRIKRGDPRRLGETPRAVELRMYDRNGLKSLLQKHKLDVHYEWPKR